MTNRRNDESVIVFLTIVFVATFTRLTHCFKRRHYCLSIATRCGITQISRGFLRFGYSLAELLGLLPYCRQGLGALPS
jgi:hypothetical protein